MLASPPKTGNDARSLVENGPRIGSATVNLSIIENIGGIYFANGVTFGIPFKHANDKSLNNSWLLPP